MVMLATEIYVAVAGAAVEELKQLNRPLGLTTSVFKNEAMIERI